jgi:hypothetical protein
MKSIRIVINRLTGVTARRNRALRYANDWAESINHFLETRKLSENIDINKFLEHGGEVMFEITVLSHKGRTLVRQAGNLKDKQVAELIRAMTGYLDSTRRYLFSPAAQKEKLRQTLINLRTSCQDLQKILAEI